MFGHLDSAAQATLNRWHEMAQARDFSHVWTLMHPDIVFRSPMAHSPYRGVQRASLILNGAMSTFEDFVYERAFIADAYNVGLEFSAHIDQRALKGIDLIRFAPNGKMLEFEVMVRPASGLAILGEHMKAKVGASLAQK